MRSWFLFLLFLVLLGSIGFLVYRRTSRNVGEPNGSAPAASSPAVPAAANLQKESLNIQKNQGTPVDAVAKTSDPAMPAEASVAVKYKEAILAAEAAGARKDLPARARHLTVALNVALSREGKEGWSMAEPAAALLRETNQQLWFNPDETFRSTTERPAPLAKIISQLAKKNPPVRVGIGLLAKMNRLADVNVVPGHKRLRIPDDSLNITVRRKSFSLVLYLGEYALDAFPIGIGKPSSPTPEGKFEIRELQHLDQYKREATKWVRPEDGKELYYGDLEYPFGKRFLRFTEPFDHYGIHGTDRDDAIGAAISHGCVRMKNVDVETLANYLDTASSPKIVVSIE